MKKRIMFLTSFCIFFLFVTFVCFSRDDVEIPNRMIITQDNTHLIVENKD